MDLGVVGADSSHLPEFSRRIAERHKDGRSPCRVVACFDDGDHDWPNPDDVANWRRTSADLGVEFVGSMDELLERVQGVLVLSVSGDKHLPGAAPALERGLATYVDKPLACTLDEARAIRDLASANNARCYSASSLRFITELDAIPRDDLGEIVAIDAFGPGELNDGAPGLLHYGVHTIEMIDAVWGPGVKRVSAIETPDRHLVDLDYADGRYARLRLERRGAYDFGATIHGTKGIHTFKVDFAPVYDRLVDGMVGFFEGRDPPASLDRIVENVAVMTGGNESAARDGAWIEIAT
ncbi:MAG: Gfo/Idh/MocA family oxidoreductase [Phycisphaerales bacterium]